MICPFECKIIGKAEGLARVRASIHTFFATFGGDREVTTVALLPPTCLVVWMGDAQQTPGGIAKGHDQFAISRRQLMMRKHGLRCPQTDVTPHSLSTILCALLQEVDDPSATALAEVLASASSHLGPLWVDQPNQDQNATLDILDTFCPGGNLRWQAPSTQDIQNHPQSPNVLIGSACNPTTFFCCERLSASMARSLRLELYLYTAVDSRPGPGGSRTTASCQP